MKLSDFDYYLPKELIAQEPLEERDGSRLMVIERKDRSIRHRFFWDIIDYLKPRDLLVLNDTKVIPARLLGKKKYSGGKVDVLLANRLSPRRFQALIQPGLRIGQEVLFNHGSMSAVLSEKGILEFNRDIPAEVLEEIGRMPLPPYIKRLPRESDAVSYQTVYARSPGAVASPTAGRHFTKSLLEEIEARSVDVRYLTLHVGPGTFKPVKCDDIEDHQIEPEEFSVPEETMKALDRAKQEDGRVFAVGTTTTRVLETVGKIADEGRMTKDEGRKHTDLFIYPGYNFRVVDCLLTNFHLPKTTLFMLVCAFAGGDLITRAYQEAVKERYRFYSYGDAMLII